MNEPQHDRAKEIMTVLCRWFEASGPESNLVVLHDNGEALLDGKFDLHDLAEELAKLPRDQ